MDRFKIFAAISALTLGLVSCVLFLIEKQWAEAICVLCLGVGCAAVLLLGFAFIQQSVIFSLIGVVAVCSGIAAPFISSNLLNSKLQSGYHKAMLVGPSLSQTCQPPTQELIQLGQYLTMVCSQQGVSEQMTLTGDLAKALYLPSGAALVDSAASAFGGKPVSRCARAYKIAAIKCPSAFISMSDDEKAALSEAAGN